MEEPVLSHFEMAFGAFLLTVFLVFSISINQEYDRSIEALNKANETSNPVVYEKYKGTMQQEIVIERTELMSCMMKSLDYPVRINGYTITPESYYYLNYDYTSIPDGEYKVTYQYYEDGSIKLICYDQIS